MNTRYLSFFASLLLTSGVAAGTAERYLTVAIEEYEARHDVCWQQQDVREFELSDASVKALSLYPPDDVSVYLMARSAQLLDQCTQPHLGQLAITLLTLEPADLSADVREKKQGIKALVFAPIRWTFEQQYQTLPIEMREHLGALPELQSPFNSAVIRDQLGIK